MILGLDRNPQAQCFKEIDEAVRQMTERLVVFNAHDAPPAPRDSVIYSLENLGARPEWMCSTLENEVWDFNKDNLRFYPKEMGVKHAPIGYHPSMKRFERIKKPDIDLVFSGTLNHRRRQLIEEIRARGFTVETLSEGGTYGVGRNAILARARLALNLHYYEYSMLFESVRVSHLVANGVPVLTEESNDHEERTWGLESFPYDRLLIVATDWLSGPQNELDKMAQFTLEKFKQKLFTLPLTTAK